MRLSKGSPLACLAAVALGAVVGAGVRPAVAQSDDLLTIDSGPGAGIPPGPVPRGDTVEPTAAETPAQPSAHTAAPANGAAAAPPAASTPKKAAVAATGKKEVLPWANTPKVPLSTVAPGVDPAAAEAAAAQCGGLFEAACRDLKTCAWIADVVLEDGTTSPARCVVRPPAPPKKTAKTPAAPAKPKKTSADTPADPAAKAPVKPPEKAPEKKTERAPAPKEGTAGKTAATEPAKAAPPQNVEKKVEKAEKAEKKGPIVVTAPPQAAADPQPAASKEEASAPPSFGSAMNGLAGTGNEVVVTVPSSQ